MRNDTEMMNLILQIADTIEVKQLLYPDHERILRHPKTSSRL